MGVAKSSVIYPDSVTLSQLTEEEPGEGGIKPETIRLSFRLEGVSNIITELDKVSAVIECVSNICGEITYKQKFS